MNENRNAIGVSEEGLPDMKFRRESKERSKEEEAE